MGSLGLPSGPWVVLCKLKDYLEIVWQPGAAQDLLWSLVIKTLPAVDLMLFTTLLKGRPQISWVLNSMAGPGPPGSAGRTTDVISIGFHSKSWAANVCRGDHGCHKC